MIVVFMIVLVTKYDSYFNLESPIVWSAFLNNYENQLKIRFFWIRIQSTCGNSTDAIFQFLVQWDRVIGILKNNKVAFQVQEAEELW